MNQIIIDGRGYEVPEFADITIGQARIIKRYTGRTLEELAETTGTDPDVVGAFCHLALALDSPHKSFATIEREVEAIRFAQLVFPEVESDEEEAAPDAVPPPSSTNGSASDGSSSGSTSAPPSAETPETIPLATGDRTSDTGAPSPPSRLIASRQVSS